jgi:hypothetical protein
MEEDGSTALIADLLEEVETLPVELRSHHVVAGQVS